MLLTIANKDAAIAQVEGPQAGDVTPFPDAIRKRVLNSTVRLSGTGKDGVSGFDGSGVIFDVDSSFAYVLTAAHNVSVWATPEDPATDWDTFATAFGAAIKIGYGGNADMKFNKGPAVYSNKAKNTVGPPPLQTECGREVNCLYDVLVIQSSDAGLRTYAQNFVFGGKSFQDIATQVKKEYAAIGTAPDSFLDWKSYYFVQLGYGKTTDDRQREKIVRNLIVKGAKVVKRCEVGTAIIEGNLQYRLTNPGYKESKTVYNQSAGDGQAPSYEAFVDAISISGPISSTTAVGDSGGPLYAVDKKFGAAYLLGVTTGADMLAAQEVSNRVFRNVISTSLAPYFKSEY